MNTLYAFDVPNLWSVVQSNINYFDYSLGTSVFGALPTIARLASRYAASNNLIVLVVLEYITSGYVQVSFDTLNTKGAQLWATDYQFVAVNESEIDLLPLVSAFTTQQYLPSSEQYTSVGSYDERTWVCLSIGNLLCIEDIAVYQQNLTVYDHHRFWGKPTAGPSQSLVWKTRGFTAFVMYVQNRTLGWSGLSWGTEGYRGGLLPSQLFIEEISCQDPLVSNRGLFLKCELDGPQKPLRITLVDSTSGIILMIYGPEVSSLPGTMFLTSNGGQLVYVSPNNAIVGQTLESQEGEYSVANYAPLFGTCASTDDATYMFAKVTQNQFFVSIKTPFDPSVDTVATFIEDGGSIYSSVTFPTFIKPSQPDSHYPTYTVANIITVSGSLVSVLYDSLFPPLLDEYFIYIQAVSPVYITTQAGSQVIMSAQYCNNCVLDCPTFCVLELSTGDQVFYTAYMEEIVGLIKTYGRSSFDPGNTTTVTSQFSGNVSLNAVRYLYTLTTSEVDSYEQVLCQNTSTTLATPGRYCIRGTDTSWSAIEVASDSSVTATTFSQVNSAADGSSRFNPFTVHNNGSVVYSVVGQLGISRLLNDSRRALPQFVDQSKVAVNSVNGVVQVNESLIIITNAGNLTYTIDECAVASQAIPMCDEALRPFVKSEMVDHQYQTVQWTAVARSNWGSGFVASGYQVGLEQILREPKQGEPIVCVNSNSPDSRCIAVCQPTTHCNSLAHFYTLSAFYLQSWFEPGSGFADEEASLARCGDTLYMPNTTDNSSRLQVRLYPVGREQVVVTVERAGSEWVLFTYPSDYSNAFGVSFSSSHCQFYILTNIVAQPFGWLAICAVKTLLVTLTFYFIEHKVRTVERRRNTIRNVIDESKRRLENLKAERQSMGPTTLPPLREHSDVDIVELLRHRGHRDSQRDTDASTRASAQINELERCIADDEQASKSSSFLPNLVDAFVSMVASFAAFRHPREKGSFHRQVRNNLLFIELSDMDLTSLLCELLDVPDADGDARELVRQFSQYYQSEMCNDTRWVVRSGNRDDQVFEGDAIRRVQERHLKEVHDRLRAVFKLYQCHPKLRAAVTHQNTIHHTKKEVNKQTEGERQSLPVDEHAALLVADINSATKYTSPGDVDSATFESILTQFHCMVASFNELHSATPSCFQFAILPQRGLNALLQPSAILLSLSLIQSAATILLYTIDIYVRSRSTPVAPLQIYQCIYFMVFNSSLPSSILVSAVLYGDMQQRPAITTIFSRMLNIIRNPFVIASVLLLAPPLITHVIPGFFLYFWVTIPLIGVSVGVEYLLRQKSAAGQPSKALIALRMCSRVLLLFAASIALSISFNTADAFLWQGINPHITGTYMKQPYFDSLAQDYQARSLDCVWEHIFHTISNFLQMGFLLV